MRMSKKKRATVVRRTAVGVAAGAAVGVAVAGAVSAARKADQTPPKLPAPGATIEADLASKGLELSFAGQKVKTGPLQGKAAFEIEVNKGDPSSVRTRVNEFYLTSPEDKGAVTVAVSPIAHNVKDQSVLRLAKTASPKFHHTLKLALTVTVGNPRALGLPAETDEPLVLTVREPAELLGKLTGFPAAGSAYKLDGPTPLSLPGQPKNDIASILKFPLKLEAF